MAQNAICKNCAQNFVIEDEDLVFYDTISPIFNGKKYSIPPPTRCPDCRLQRRIAWRNERFLYKTTCSKCKKEIVTVFAPGSAAANEARPIYCNACWWGDTWDGRDYGRVYDLRPLTQIRRMVFHFSTGAL